jgi:hypothetical protein
MGASGKLCFNAAHTILFYGLQKLMVPSTNKTYAFFTESLHQNQPYDVGPESTTRFYPKGTAGNPHGGKVIQA